MGDTEKPPTFAILTSDQLTATGRWDPRFNIPFYTTHREISQKLMALGHGRLNELIEMLPLSQRGLDTVSRRRRVKQETLKGYHLHEKALYVAIAIEDDVLLDQADELERQARTLRRTHEKIQQLLREHIAE